MDIPFTKASACGNDFLIIDGTLAPDRLHEVTRQICDRHNGVGADGVEWLFTDSDADVEARLINADGSDAEISGNGTRCVAAFLCAESKKESVTIRTGAGVKKCTLMARNGNTSEFEAAMGAPQCGRRDVDRNFVWGSEGYSGLDGEPAFCCVCRESLAGLANARGGNAA